MSGVIDMRLSDLKDVLNSQHGDMQFAIVYDVDNREDIENGCSVEYAIKNYGDCELVRISADKGNVVLHIRGCKTQTQKESLRDDYKDRKPIAYDAVNYTGLEILDIEYGIDDYAIVRDRDGNVRKYKINYDTNGNDYIKCYGRKLPIGDFMRTDI